jgi:hypothetical protein
MKFRTHRNTNTRTRVIHTSQPQISRGLSGGDTPGHIPNPEVKPSSADGTAGATRWESRSPREPHTSRPPTRAASTCVRDPSPPRRRPCAQPLGAPVAAALPGRPGSGGGAARGRVGRHGPPSGRHRVGRRRPVAGRCWVRCHRAPSGHRAVALTVGAGALEGEDDRQVGVVVVGRRGGSLHGSDRPLLSGPWVTATLRYGLQDAAPGDGARRRNDPDPRDRRPRRARPDGLPAQCPSSSSSARSSAARVRSRLASSVRRFPTASRRT